MFTLRQSRIFYVRRPRTMPRKRANGRRNSARAVESRVAEVAPEIIVDSLTDKEWKFIENYFIHNLNGTEAALATFDTTDRGVASVIACEYLAKPKIKDRVNARLDEFHMGD